MLRFPTPNAVSAPWFIWLLRLILVVLVLRLLIGDNPFTDGLAEREAAGKRARPRDFATTYTWWMALVNVFAAGIVLATWRRFRGPTAPPGDSRFAAPGSRPPGWLIAGVGFAMLGLAITAAPRLSQSLWEDEAYMVVRSIAGQYEMGEDGNLEFDSVDWVDTFYYYRKPNNHVPYSLVARLAHQGFSAVTRPDHQLVNEVVVRMPALVAGLAGVGTLAWLLWRLGLPLAGLAGAWLLALHPWYLRYASEVRGYAFMLALLPCLLIAALRALERGSWGRWGTFGALQMLLLWSYPGALFVLVIANLYLFFEVARTPGAGRPVQLTRLFVANVGAALAWLQMNLPNMMQFIPYSERWKGEVSSSLLLEIASHLALGMPWLHRRDGFVSFQNQLEVAPLITVLAALGMVALVGLGALRLARAGSPAACVLAVLLLPGPLTILLAMLRGDHLYTWYLIHSLPGVAILAGAGLTLPAAFGTKGRLPASVLAVAFLGFFFVATHAQRVVVRERAVQPTRDLVRTVRPNPNPLAAEQAEILTGAVYGPPRYYDPHTVDLPTPEAVYDMMRRADREGLPLYVTYNRPKLAANRRGEALALLDQEELFELIVVIEGLEPKSQHVAYRYRSGAFEGD